MRVKEMARALGGAFAVYAAIAACSAATAPSNDVDGGGPIGNAPPSATTSTPAPTSTGAMMDAMLAVVDAVADVRDAVSEPVPDAQAAPPEVKTVQCLQSPPTGPDYRYAEQAYPGKTANELASVIAIANYPVGSTAVMPGYQRGRIGSLFVKDGYVAVYCSLSFDEVTFIRQL